MNEDRCMTEYIRKVLEKPGAFGKGRQIKRLGAGMVER